MDNLRYEIMSPRHRVVSFMLGIKGIPVFFLIIVLVTIIFANEKIYDFKMPIFNHATALYIPPSPINGSYHSEKIGFSIELPMDWSSTVVDYPSGFYSGVGGIITIRTEPNTFVNGNKLYKSQPVVVIQAMDELKLENLKNLSRILSNISSIESNDSTSHQKNITCAKTSDFVTINTATGNYVAKKCKTPKPILYESYIFVTGNRSLIHFEYIGDFTKENDRYADQFERAVKTLKIFNPADVRDSQVYLDYINSVHAFDDERIAKILE